jgi:SAM-dependent methyltransferase
MNRKEHWESVYSTKGETEVGWYQSDPAVSMELYEAASPEHGNVIDVGGGTSLLVDRLLDAGAKGVGVLDISAVALERAKARLGPRANQVRWVVADVTQAQDLGRFDVWHDRAVFHFLTSPEDRRRYVELAVRTIPVGGHLIVGTFALDGPPKCSGLDVCRYDTAMLSSEFGESFLLVKDTAHTHFTPKGNPQQFIFGLFKRL